MKDNCNGLPIALQKKILHDNSPSDRVRKGTAICRTSKYHIKNIQGCTVGTSEKSTKSYRILQDLCDSNLVLQDFIRERIYKKTKYIL